MSPSTPYPEVTSVRTARASPGICRRTQLRVRVAVVQPVTIMYASSDILVTVRSASIPPPPLSICRIATLPGFTPTSLAQMRCRTASASGPWTRNLANEDWSKSPTASLTARCSSAVYGNQFCRPNEYTSLGSTPSGAYQLGLSHPAATPKQARRAASRSCSAERRAGRAVSNSFWGQCMPLDRSDRLHRTVVEVV